MTPEQKRLVRENFALIEPIADLTAALFYQRLFELDPSLRPLFRGDMAEQGRKLMQTLAVVVRGLDRLEAVLPSVEALGRRHAGDGVRDEHYATVATALLWTLEQGLGPACFTPAAHAAWTAAYTTLVGVMRDAAADAARPAASRRAGLMRSARPVPSTAVPRA
jgi:hemoglobin-like flavoprotein